MVSSCADASVRRTCVRVLAHHRARSVRGSLHAALPFGHPPPAPPRVGVDAVTYLRPRWGAAADDSSSTGISHNSIFSSATSSARFWQLAIWRALNVRRASSNTHTRTHTRNEQCPEWQQQCSGSHVPGLHEQVPANRSSCQRHPTRRPRHSPTHTDVGALEQHHKVAAHSNNQTLCAEVIRSRTGSLRRCCGGHSQGRAAGRLVGLRVLVFFLYVFQFVVLFSCS